VRSTRRLLFALVFLIAAPTWVGHATLVRPFSLAGLTLESHSIVRGEVEEIEALFDPTWGNIYTHTRVRVTESLHGDAAIGDHIVVRQLGGVLDGITSRIVGNAELGLGSEVVLFTRTDGALHYVIGMAQGKFEVVREPGVAPRVVRSRAGLTSFVPITLRSTPDTLSLDGLRRRIVRAQEGE